jgi:hypothetical protein
MQTWTLHEQMLRNPPTDRMRDVHMLHHAQSVPMLDETSALHGNMSQRNDEEGGKQPRLFFSPAASVWGQMITPLHATCRIRATPLSVVLKTSLFQLPAALLSTFCLWNSTPP